MQILSIHLKNIKSHRDTELSFSAGINVLAGPNGVGKSTVFEAIGYALFGVDARDFVSNVDRFLTIGAKRGDISVVFRTDSGETWRVSRTVGAAAKWLLAREVGDIFEVEDHARIEETEARIAELLGLRNGRPLAEQFKLVIGPFQNDFLGPFVIKQPTKRQETFDEILGIDAWRKTYKGTASLLSAIQKRSEILAAEVAGKEEQVAVLPAKSAELATVRSDCALRQQEVGDKEQALTLVAGRLAELEATEKVIATLGNELAVLENRIKDGNAKIGDQQLRVEESRQALTIVAAAKEGKEAFDRAEIRLAELRLKEQQRRLVEGEIAGLDKQALTLSQKLDHEQAEIGAIDAQLATEQERMAADRRELRPDPARAALAARLPEIRRDIDLAKGERALVQGRRESLLEGKEKLASGICPFFREKCKITDGNGSDDIFGSRIAELESMTGTLDGKLAQLTLELKDAETADKELRERAIRLQELDKQAATLEERRTRNRERSTGLGEIRAQLTDASTRLTARRDDLKSFIDLDAAIAAAEKERQQHRPTHDAYTANQNVARDLESRQEHLHKMQQLLDKLSGELTAKQAELTGRKHDFQPELLLQTRRDKEQLLAHTAALRQQISDLARSVDRLENEIAHLEKIRQEIGVKQAEIKSCADREKLVKFLRKDVFSRMSAQLSERFREEITQRADRIYRTISGADEELLWGENYQIVLRDMVDGTIRERSDDQLSGGQTMSAVVALRLALLQTIGARFAFFDEPTSNLDSSRRENLAQAFRAIDVGREEVTEHWYDQLFLVSHDVAFTEITDQMIHLGESSADTP